MNRRDFLKYVGTGLVVGPAAARAILAAPIEAAAPSPLALWTAPRWWVKEFDWGNKFGVALGLTNPRTGKTVRNAVRMDGRLSSEFMNRVWADQDFGGGITSFADPPEGIRAAQRLLEAWAEEEAWRQGLATPPKGWKPWMPPGVRGDDVLEGREMQMRRP